MKKRALGIIFLTVFIDLVGFGIVIPLSPYLSREFGADAFQIGALMSVYSLMQFLFSPFWGQLSDRYGRRPIILMSLVVAGLSHLGFAFANTFWLLFVARMFAGIGGANISTTMAYIADITGEKDRSKGMGLIGAAFGLGFVVGPFLGGVFGSLGESLGSAPPFGQSFAALVASVICLVNAVFAYFFLDESLSQELRKSAVTQQQRAKGLIQRIQMINKWVQKPTLGKLLLMNLLFVSSVANMESSLFLYVQDLLGWDLKTASYGFAYLGVVMVITQGYIIRKWLPKVGEAKMLITGAVLAGVGFAMIALSHQIANLTVAVTLMALGMGLFNPSLSGSVSLLAPADVQGQVMGVFQSLSALGRILGPLMGGALYKYMAPQFPFIAASLLVLIVITVLLTLIKEIPDRGLEKS